ncbi:hypothetical protein KAU43_05025 [candidate division WOR-3 bacterium]|nr:hypothetical protein [candidate division WOR-3 bacterium]
MNPKYEELAKTIEGRTGFGIMNKSEIKDDKSAKRIFREHLNWVLSNSEDAKVYCDGLIDNELGVD